MFVLKFPFLDASSHLYMPVCLSVRPSLRPSVRPSSLARASDRVEHDVVVVVVARGIRLSLLSPVWLTPHYSATADRGWRERLSEHR